MVFGTVFVQALVLKPAGCHMAKASEAGGGRTSEVRRFGASLRTVIVGLGLGLSFQAFPSIAQTPGQPPDTMAARIEACTPCHGDMGR
jgi:hypothetical protein